MGLHVSDHFAEFLAEHVAKQTSRHVQALFAVVVTIVLGSAVKVSCNQTADHVSSEEGLLEEVALLDSNVGKELLAKDAFGNINTAFTISLNAPLVSEGDGAIVDNAVDCGALLSDEIETVVLALVDAGFLERGTESLSHVGVFLVGENHVEYLLVALTAERAEKDNHRDIVANLRNRRVYLSSTLSFLDVDLELKGGFVVLFILRTDLGVPTVLACGQLIMENQHNIAGLLFLGNNNLFGTIDDKIASLVIHALLVSHDALLVAVVQVALRAANHDWYFAQLNALGRVLDQAFFGLVTLASAFLDVNIHLGVDLVSKVADSRLVREIRV